MKKGPGIALRLLVAGTAYAQTSGRPQPQVVDPGGPDKAPSDAVVLPIQDHVPVRGRRCVAGEGPLVLQDHSQYVGRKIARASGVTGGPPDTPVKFRNVWMRRLSQWRTISFQKECLRWKTDDRS